jgi:hypothetical protein
MFPSGIKGKNMLVFHFSKVELRRIFGSTTNLMELVSK